MSAGPLLLTLIAALLKTALLLALAAAIVATLKRASGRVRHSIWAGALVGALLVPMVAPWVPDWSIAALPAPALSRESLVTQADSRPARSLGAVRRAETRMSPAASAPRAGTVADGDPSSELWKRVKRSSPASRLLGLWLLGFGVALLGFLRSLRGARRLERQAIVAAAPWRRELEDVKSLVGVRRRVRLLESASTATPMTWGWLRPVILVPVGSRRWSAERRRVVLLHELVHVRRADWLVRLLARLVCAVYWLNPLVWLAARRLAVEQEIACDEEVVALGTRPSSYARHLLTIARTLGAADAAPAHALDMARRSQMEGRLMSILDGGRRLRGGGKLAILALLLIAGLVPALAAIEPWIEEQEAQPPSPRIGGARAPAGADTAGLVAALGELEAVARQMEPFEAELESLEAEMEPIEEALAAVEVEIQPVEIELESVEVELEPFEVMLAAVEVEMGPFQERLEAIEVELEPFEERLEQVEVEMRPFEEQLEAIEIEMRPFEEQLEAIEIEMEPFQEELERISEQLEPLARDGGQSSAQWQELSGLMERMHESLTPLHERMGATHEAMEPLFERLSSVHEAMAPLHERVGGIHQEMEPVYERMAVVHQELEPLHERMSAVHEQMKPVYERLSAAHERMSPFHERMGEQHERMQPFHRKMGEIHERMRPLYEEMGERHRELERQLKVLIERMLATELAAVTAPSTDYAPIAEQIVDEVSLRVEDGTLRIMSSAPQLRSLLGEALGSQATASAEEFAAAAERFVRALGDLEVSAP